MTTSRDKHKVVVAAALIVISGIVLVSCIKEDVVSENVWVLGMPLGGLRVQEALALIEERVNEIQEGPLVFKAGDLSYEVSPEELEVVLDPGQIRARLEAYIGSKSIFLPASHFRKGPKTVVDSAAAVVSPALNEVARKIADNLCKEPLPERYGFSGHDLVILPAENGQVVTPEDVLEALENIEGATVEVPFQVTEPEMVRVEPLELVASAETNYDIEETDRNVNLALAAKAVRGQVLMPGQTYSFNRAAGERSEARGYRYANVVVGNRLVPDIGGGICQVTTTLFMAAAKSGLDFPELHNHGIPVDYAPPGLDAAVAWDYLDLKIRNNFDHPVVFGAWVEDGMVLVRLFGKPLESTYELEPVILEEYPQEGMNPGLLVETYRVEKQGDEVKRRQLLVRSYYLPSYPNPK
ncbi:MAG: VanW family protein [Bacillota bacterium]|nr:VanW family protein [Candidatus Fermentithermobacillaceae bacterium]